MESPLRLDPQVRDVVGDAAHVMTFSRQYWTDVIVVRKIVATLASNLTIT